MTTCHEQTMVKTSWELRKAPSASPHSSLDEGMSLSSPCGHVRLEPFCFCRTKLAFSFSLKDTDRSGHILSSRKQISLGFF